MEKYLIQLLISCSFVFGQGTDSLVGVWQDAEVVGSGWSNTFLFYNDGTFKFFYSQMDMRKRETGYSGTWYVEGDGLILDVTQRQFLDDGRLVPDQTGGPKDSVLIDAVSRTTIYNPPDRNELSISKIYSGGPSVLGKYIYLDAIKFFLMSKNPAELLHEFEDK